MLQEAVLRYLDLAAANDAIVYRSVQRQKVLQKTTTSVWDTARCFWREVWSMVWKLRICGLTRCSWLLKGMQDKQMEVLECIKMFV